MRKVCVFTGSRAEYGLLRPLIDKIQLDSDLKLQLIVSAMHLSPEFGLTYKEIETDGFRIDEKVEILMSSDSPIGLCKSMGLGLISFSEALERLCPDILVILGDRFEAFAVASAAMISRIPIAHLHGGEATEGLIDEPIRHSITKMSHLHFTSTDVYRNRVIQLGELPEKVFNVGALGVQSIKKMRMLSKAELEKELNFTFGKMNIMVTYHPVSLEKCTAGSQFRDLLIVLGELEDTTLIFTKANADTDGRIINEMIDKFVLERSDRSIAFTSMGQLKYLSAMKYSNAVVGNSSSGIIEAPSMEIPTINIGDRQKGRVRAKSVIDCSCEKDQLREAIQKGIAKKNQSEGVFFNNPYEKENTVEEIHEKIKKINLDGVLKKRFYDVQ